MAKIDFLLPPNLMGPLEVPDLHRPILAPPDRLPLKCVPPGHRRDEGVVSDQDNLNAAVRALVNRHDPAGLIAAGFPANEYEPEVRDLVDLVRSQFAIDDATTNAVWQKWFSDPSLLERVGKSSTFSLDLARLRHRSIGAVPEHSLPDTQRVTVEEPKPSPTIVTETFGYTRSDLSTVGRAVALGSWRRRASVILLAALTIVAPLVGLRGSALVGFEAAAVAVVLLTLFPGVLQARGTTITAPRRFEFSDQGIGVYEAGSESRRAWSTVTRVQRVKGRRLLFISARQAIVIPDRVLTKAEQTRLDRLIDVHVSRSPNLGAEVPFR